MIFPVVFLSLWKTKTRMKRTPEQNLRRLVLLNGLLLFWRSGIFLGRLSPSFVWAVKLLGCISYWTRWISNHLRSWIVPSGSDWGCKLLTWLTLGWEVMITMPSWFFNKMFFLFTTAAKVCTPQLPLLFINYNWLVVSSHSKNISENWKLPR